MRNLCISFGIVILQLATCLYGQSLAVKNHDFIGFRNDYPQEPYILKAEDNHYYLLTGCDHDFPEHPLLGNGFSNYKATIFMKYDPDGNPVWENHTFGSTVIINADMQDDNLLAFVSANSDVYIEENLIALDTGNTIEYIVKYDKDGNYIRHASLWIPSKASPRSDKMVISPLDGSVFVYGTNSNSTLTLTNSTVLGNEWEDGYIYVLKYSKDLEFEWAYTTGFNNVVGFGYYNKIVGIPDVRGNLLLTGIYACNTIRPVFGNDTLAYFPDSHGIFAYKLSGNGEPVWAKQGSLYGYTYDGFGVYEGYGISNGDYILAAATITGRFQLSNADVIFDNSEYRENHLVMRMDPDGNIVWAHPVQSMGNPSTEKKSAEREIEEIPGKKEALSDQYGYYLHYDALQLHEDKIYIIGYTAIDSLTIAGKKLPNINGKAIFVASLNIDDGSENWGHTVSGENIYFSGFGVDRNGNVVISGSAENVLSIDGMGEKTVNSPGWENQFMYGLNYDGNPIWYNSVYLMSSSEGLILADMEILDNGTAIASLYIEKTEYMLTGNQSFMYDFPFGNYMLLLDEPNQVSGKVTTVEQAAVYPGMVKAIYQADEGVFPAVDSAELGDDGSFSFANLMPGNYTFSVEADPTMYPDAYATYLMDQVYWMNAEFFAVNITDTLVDKNIVLAEYPPLSPGNGSGQVLGNISYTAGGKKAAGQAVKEASVVLVSKAKKSTMADITAVVRTNDNGDYTFDNVPDGGYEIMIDIPGLEMVRTYDVSITGNQMHSGLDFIVDVETGIDIIWGVGINNKPESAVKLYPNPGKGEIYIENSDESELFITIYSIDAKMVLATRIKQNGNSKYLDISYLEPGIYFIKIESGTTNSILKYLLE